MIARRPVSFVPVAAVSLVTLLWVGVGPESRGQHTPDPYNIVGEYNNQYEPYMYATYPTAPGIQPNQGRFEGRSGARNANSFQKFLDSESDEPNDAGRTSAPRQSGPGTPYYRAYRRFDQEFGRTYRPNESADRSYYNDQEKRNDKYFQALREPDPRKRSQLLRDYNLDNMRAARDLSSGRTTSERDREPPRDRFTPGGASLYPEGTEAEENRAPRAGAAPAARAPGGPAAAPITRPSSGSPAPPARRSPTGLAPSAAPARRDPGSAPASGGLSRPGTRAPRAPASASPARPGTGARPTTTDLLNRSELLDRATRATAPLVPRSTVPAPR